ncbi:hypothetical protein LCGC14_1275550, partial [marine sediment metagenome]
MTDRTKRVMDRREFLGAAGRSALAVGAAGLLPAGLGWAARAGKRPNIVLILIDDLGWADVGYQGSTFYKTPNIDRLAAGGMTFTDAYAACPLCSPTRASILTGKNPARLHLTKAITANTRSFRAEDKKTERPWWKLVAPGSATELPLGEVTIAERLRQAGYVTGFFGKWHLGKKAYRPEEQGFDVNVGGGFYPSP